MNTIKLFVTHTPNKENRLVELPIIQNVIAGADYQIKPIPEGVIPDNTGDNISRLNKSYCELTTQYWAWKNVQADYYGFCHYRRLFSFNKENLTEDGWGTVAFPYLNDVSLKELCFDEAHIRDQVEKYDFIIAKGIDVKLLKARSVSDHYRKAKELNYSDFELMMGIIKEKYSFLYDAAEKYAQGHIFYPCNMFIMNRELFCQYSEILFGILSEFEKKCDMSHYSMQTMRTTGHLGERIAGIYYCYIESLKKYKTKELQIALFKNTEKLLRIEPSEEENSVPIVLAANDFYVPYMSVCIQSIIDTSNQDKKYKIYVFHTDISLDNQKLLKQQILKNPKVWITFIPIGEYVDSYKLKAKDHITTETFYRFLILDIMKGWKKVIYLDCDLVVLRDLAELYAEKMDDMLIGAVRDVDFAGQLNSPWLRMKEYEEKNLKLEKPYQYFQAGVLLLHVELLRGVVTSTELLGMAETGIYKYSDQDILNVLCQGKVHFLDMAWNVITDCNGKRISDVASRAPAQLFEAYMESRKAPYIIHYAGIQKPWKMASEDFGWVFWEIARNTPYYEQILQRMCAVPNKAKKISIPQDSGMVKKIGYYLFPVGTKRRELIKKIYYSVAG